MVRKEGLEIFLQETKLVARKMESLKFSVWFDGCLVVDSVGRSGGLALMWKMEIQVTVKSFSKYHIDAKISAEEESVE